MRESENSSAIAPPISAAAASAARVMRKRHQQRAEEARPVDPQALRDRARRRQDIGRDAAPPHDGLPQREEQRRRSSERREEAAEPRCPVIARTAAPSPWRRARAETVSHIAAYAGVGPHCALARLRQADRQIGDDPPGTRRSSPRCGSTGRPTRRRCGSRTGSVGRCVCHSRSRSSLSAKRVISSSAANGSSSSSSSGPVTSARAIDTRIRMPPDSWCG